MDGFPFRLRALAALAVVTTAAFGFAGCGGDDDDNGGETPTAGETAPAESPTEGESPANGETATVAESPTAAETATSEAPGELQEVTLMLDWVPNTHHAGIYIAAQEGYYEEAGLDVEIVEPGQAGVPQVVASGQVEFGISVQESVIPARAEGVPIVSIAAIKQHNDSSLIMLESEGVESPADLAGLTYGGFGGPLETQLIRQLVECSGGDPDEVTFVEVGNVPYLQGMERGQYDFVWVFESWDTIRFREIDGAELTSIRFIDHLDCIPDWYTPVFITSEDLIASDPDVVSAFLEATTRGYEAAMEDADLATEALTSAVPEIDEELVRLSAEYHVEEQKYVDEGRQWGLQDEEIWTEFVTFLLDAGLIDEEIDVSSAYTNEFLPER